MSNIISSAPTTAAILRGVLAPITPPLEGRRAQDKRNDIAVKAFWEKVRLHAS
jgi:hypothetical protein